MVRSKSRKCSREPKGAAALGTIHHMTPQSPCLQGPQNSLAELTSWYYRAKFSSCEVIRMISITFARQISFQSNNDNAHHIIYVYIIIYTCGKPQVKQPSPWWFASAKWTASTYNMDNIQYMAIHSLAAGSCSVLFRRFPFCSFL